jgi:hypothetical protein
LLRFTTDVPGAGPPDVIRVNGRKVRMARKKAGVYEAGIGYADPVPGIMEIAGRAGEEGFSLRVRFTAKEAD